MRDAQIARRNRQALTFRAAQIETRKGDHVIDRRRPARP
jgi:hypothetical protein